MSIFTCHLLKKSMKENEETMIVKDWLYVADKGDLPEGSIMPVYPMGIHVILARIEDIIYAFNGKCLHMACPLYTGTLEGNILTCPCHDWRYDLKTGQFLDAPELRLESYPVKFSDGKIFIKL